MAYCIANTAGKPRRARAAAVLENKSSFEADAPWQA
jgi:hypothetical protein